ncbi:MAG: YihY/virulence factor BrkB family protein [Planctomycetes bacterium]|nr:YihY/virulence factor BrkB family protein [Planctomycetota bacterium]
MFTKISLRIFWRACQQFGENNDSRLGAALAYYTLFSVAPLLVIAIYMAGLMYGADAASGQVAKELSMVIGKDEARAVQTLIDYANRPVEGTLASLISAAVLLAGALGIFLHLRGALCSIWKLDPPHSSTWLRLLLDHLLALIMVFVVGGLLLLSLVISTFLPLLEDAVERQFPAVRLFWHVVEFAVSLVLLTILSAANFRILSGNRIPWRYVWYGSLITAFLFTLGKILLGLYLYYTGTASAYGAAGSVVIFMIWVYYSSQIVFFGAELIQARRTRADWL